MTRRTWRCAGRGGWSLRHRILAVNIFALAILAGSIFYLDSFRSRLTAGADQPGRRPRRRSSPMRSAPCRPERASRCCVRLGAGLAARGCASIGRDGAQVGRQLERRAADLRAARSGRRALVRRTSPGCSTTASTRSSARRGRRLSTPPATTGSQAWPEARRGAARAAAGHRCCAGRRRARRIITAAAPIAGAGRRCCC